MQQLLTFLTSGKNTHWLFFQENTHSISLNRYESAADATPDLVAIFFAIFCREALRRVEPIVSRDKSRGHCDILCQTTVPWVFVRSRSNGTRRTRSAVTLADKIWTDCVAAWTVRGNFFLHLDYFTSFAARLTAESLRLQVGVNGILRFFPPFLRAKDV